MPMEEGISGPHVAAAFLCEKVLTEKDGVASFIRVIERFTIPKAPKLPPGVSLPPGIQFPIAAIQFNLVVILKAGDLGTGTYAMHIDLIKPDGKGLGKQRFSVFFNGSDENGVAVISPMTIPAPEEGLHWFDIYFQEGLITRVPMRVFYQEMQMPPQM